jgi:transcriptional regulator with XRE-family HTH domain
MMDAQNMSTRQTAEEIGITHTTLSRYLRKENKRQNKNNDEKMLYWLKEKTIERKTLTTI